ncbi:radical SAM protein [Streptomyces sp. NBC_01465]|uniref:radical SAM protein n=1 Tax=Streptomyces sp. NBC_01465 TaxID=2903878 RepID=UPI002E34E3F9|nr:radical SAM protein [Streptomyces sp. NBC_01465]
MTARLNHRAIVDIRRTRGRSVLLFITDRCPVGCGHCSVDSRPDSPRITDFALLESIVDRLAGIEGLEMAGISGGEPFVERRGLTRTVRQLSEAGKHVVIYTSGFWARSERAPQWIHDVLDRSAVIYLSTDAYHVAGQGPERFGHAARVIAGHEVPIVVQCIDEGDTLQRAEEALTKALGRDWSAYAELIPTHGLPHGRGADHYSFQERTQGSDFGPCDVVDATVVRYDGRVTACCNESVIMGAGPAALRADCTTGEEVEAAVRDFHADPFYRALGSVGPGALTALPRYNDLAERHYSSICGLCWAMTRRNSEAGARTDAPLLTAIAGIGRDHTGREEHTA